MSYILEALKKAQAERQLGDTPTINAVSIQVASPNAASARTPLWAILAAALVAAAIAATFWWRQGAPAGEATLVVTPAPPAVLVRPAAPVVLAAPAPPQPPPIVVPDAIPAPMAAPAPAPPAPQAAAPSARAPGPAPEEALPFARDLPEQVRSSLPQVVFGGYMYSPNPADRLLLIDKVLRHEGEEVAPGLTLEKLLPKAAVMNFRGTRYRVAY